MNERLKPILTELRIRLEALYGERLDRLVLFGSQARGDADPDSDIDVLVVLKGDVDDDAEIERTGAVMSDLSLRYGVVLSGVWVSSREYHARRTSLVRTIHREGIAI